MDRITSSFGLLYSLKKVQFPTPNPSCMYMRLSIYGYAISRSCKYINF